ncbi:COX15/CtaA family protein [Myxococcus faecalis]|jgi:cytochrome c oxidase assembly protein subunit 15|uniref:COX15/CtaA family protein n=1 Tax=Myxococcus TaxID=32 RepID=UPI001CBDF73B|nr:COX15/CtaA family protein [Myxococcus sp. XM-1-1-1]MBZ4412079.1 COX15/CtaA family protein [Myxococcus sp. XM-1-1-1]BDT30968.1 COX15/CtaA family protein [Myxococcus sp. MH1]
MTHPASTRSFQRFSLGVLVFTLGVILWGAFVRATGSGAGCGDHWPVCNGQVVPREPTVQTLIEYTHRLTSGVVMLLAVALSVWAMRAHAKGHPVRKAANWALFFMMTEALVGAGIVLLQYVADNASVGRAVWMGVHLVNTFLLVGAQTLVVWFSKGRASLAFRGQGWVGVLVGVCVAGMMLLGVSGAVAALGDTLFPSETLAEGLAQHANDQAHLFVRRRIYHPIIAVLMGAALVYVGRWMSRLRPSPEVKQSAMLLTGLYVLQLGAGLVNVVLLAPVWLQLVHLLLADFVWMTVVRLCAAGLSKDAPRAERVSEPVPTHASAA